ncbi:hypothetical protein [Leeia oryzae]|uniref:hypothetical protein n=1 Tax=Leeia oryzae TaxID=356662 RepID=UPI00037FB088|nr:hypothetical protein [Leeia oryzae]
MKKALNVVSMLMAAGIAMGSVSSVNAATAAEIKDFKQNFFQRCVNDHVFKDVENLLAAVSAPMDEKRACNCLVEKTAKVPGIVDALANEDENSADSHWATLKVYEATFNCSAESARQAASSMQ